MLIGVLGKVIGVGLIILSWAISILSPSFLLLCLLIGIIISGIFFVGLIGIFLSLVVLFLGSLLLLLLSDDSRLSLGTLSDSYSIFICQSSCCATICMLSHSDISRSWW